MVRIFWLLLNERSPVQEKCIVPFSYIVVSFEVDTLDRSLELPYCIYTCSNIALLIFLGSELCFIKGYFCSETREENNNVFSFLSVDQEKKKRELKSNCDFSPRLRPSSPHFLSYLNPILWTTGRNNTQPIKAYPRNIPSQQSPFLPQRQSNFRVISSHGETVISNIQIQFLYCVHRVVQIQIRTTE